MSTINGSGGVFMSPVAESVPFDDTIDGFQSTSDVVQDAIHEAAKSGNVFTFTQDLVRQPVAKTAYSDMAAMTADMATVSGPKIVRYIPPTNLFGVAPVGTFDFNDAIMQIENTTTNGQFIIPLTGSFWEGLRGIQGNGVLITSPADPQALITLPTESPFFLSGQSRIGLNLAAFGAKHLFETAGSGGQNDLLLERTFLNEFNGSPGFQPIINVLSGDTLNIFVGEHCKINSNAFSGAGTINIRLENSAASDTISLTHASFTGTINLIYDTKAQNVGFDDTACSAILPSMAGIENTQEAIDQLCQNHVDLQTFHPFINETEFRIQHNRGQKPIVQVTAGEAETATVSLGNQMLGNSFQGGTQDIVQDTVVLSPSEYTLAHQDDNEIVLQFNEATTGVAVVLGVTV